MRVDGAARLFQLLPGKNLGAYGEGGAVVTSDPALAEKIRLLRSWGEETRYEHKYRGFNYRMDGVQGAVLDVKLKHLEAWTDARRSRAAEYARRLSGTPAIAAAERAESRHVYHQYVVRVPERDAWRAALTERRHSDRRPLPDAGSLAACISRPRVFGGRLPRRGTGGWLKYCRCRCFPS